MAAQPVASDSLPRQYPAAGSGRLASVMTPTPDWPTRMLGNDRAASAAAGSRPCSGLGADRHRITDRLVVTERRSETRTPGVVEQVGLVQAHQTADLDAFGGDQVLVEGYGRLWLRGETDKLGDVCGNGFSWPKPGRKVPCDAAALRPPRPPPLAVGCHTTLSPHTHIAEVGPEHCVQPCCPGCRGSSRLRPHLHHRSILLLRRQPTVDSALSARAAHPVIVSPEYPRCAPSAGT